MTDDEPRLFQARRGYSVSYRGKTLLSMIDPIGKADRVALAVARREKTLYFCPSPLFGYGLETLRSVMSGDSAILCVECDEKLVNLSRGTIDPDLLDAPRAAFVHTKDPQAVCAFVRERWGPRAFRRVEMVRLSGGWSLAEKEFEAMAQALRSDIAVHWSNAMTLVHLGRRYALNAARNLSLLPFAKDLEAVSFGRDPVLVLGAGPSMDEMANRIAGGDFASSGERPFRILCVDTAYSALLARGVAPDLVVALEAQHWNLRDFVGTSPRSGTIAVDLSAFPGTAEACGGEAVLFSTRWTSLRFLDRLGEAGLLPAELPPLGSVGLTAVAAALRITRGSVVVAGLDFSYNLDAYHARSTPSREDRLRKASRLSGLIDPAPAFRPKVGAILDKGGKPTRSDPALRGYRDLFRREFAATDRLFDAGTRGLDLGLPRMDTEAAFALLTESGDEAMRASAKSARPRAHGGIAPRASVLAFVAEELAGLSRLRDALSGKKDMPDSELDNLIDEYDYLWAHFPECAGADGKRPPLDDIPFLKRVRAEIEPFSKAFGLAERDLSAR